MVNFECMICIRTLKKKQAERHNYECRGASNFTCLTCWKTFDMDTIKAHTSCVTEQEKYQKGDNTSKKVGIINTKLDILPVNINELKWGGFRKTSKRILMGHENYKLNMKDLFEKLSQVYANYKSVEKEEVCLNLVKKYSMNKIENDEKFVIDLSKNTIRYKP